MLRGCDDLAGQAVLDDASALEHDQAIADRGEGSDVVRDDEHPERVAAFVAQADEGGSTMPIEILGMIATRADSESKPDDGPIVDPASVREFSRPHEKRSASTACSSATARARPTASPSRAPPSMRPRTSAHRPVGQLDRAHRHACAGRRGAAEVLRPGVSSSSSAASIRSAKSSTGATNSSRSCARGHACAMRRTPVAWPDPAARATRGCRGSR